MSQAKIGIIGSGSWGTAIAKLLANNGSVVKICSRNHEIISSINNTNTNKLYFPDIKLSPLISATSNISDLSNSDYIFVVIPTQVIRSFFEKNPIPTSIPLILCSKGIENSTLKFPSEIIDEILGNETLILSGPNFAKEIIIDLPAFSSLASNSMVHIKKLKELLDQPNFHIIGTNDKIGVQICSSVKNVIAIAAGMVVGMNLGENAKAALITMGILEINLLIKKLGGDSSTILSMAGIGDILLTSCSTLSRNMSFGINLARKINTDHITIEGYHNTKVLYKLASLLKLELPVTKAVYDVLYLNKDPKEIVSILLK